jgi:hypothetical protein
MKRPSNRMFDLALEALDEQLKEAQKRGDHKAEDDLQDKIAKIKILKWGTQNEKR